MSVFNHRLSRTRGANACAGRAVAPRSPRGRGTKCTVEARFGGNIQRQLNPKGVQACAPACPQWLVAICAFFAFTFTALAADSTISISARQRYPCNGLVDLHFTITGTSDAKYDTAFCSESFRLKEAT